MKIAIINGPNLNRLGQRDPEIYGSATLDEINENLQNQYNVDFHFFQSNSEGEIIDCIQAANRDPETKGIVINPGAYAHYSYAIADAIADCHKPVVEVHLSNIHAREEFRRKSVTGAAADAVISGCGAMGYQLAVNYLLSLNP